MAGLGEFWRRLWFSVKQRRMDRELAEEVRLHLEMKTREHLAAGLSAEEARRAAHRQLGNLARVEEISRESRGFPALSSIFQDVRYGLRGLRKAPGFTFVAVVTLALGTGATAAMFSIVNSILLRPLPYADSERIATVATVSDLFPELELANSKPDLADIQASAHSFANLATYLIRAANLTGDGDPEQVRVAAVSPEFFPLLGIQPAMGREFQRADSEHQNGDVVLLSYGLWQRRFAAYKEMMGRVVTLEQKPYTVIGILPQGFDFPKESDAWVPLEPGDKTSIRRDSRFFSTLVKLHTGASIASSQAELDSVARRMAHDNPQEDSGTHFRIRLLQETVTGKAKSGLLILLGAVGCLLLIACANVSNLILARGTRRQSEIALRAALGASRSRILRQLLIESLVLCLLGGLAGLLVAVLGISAYKTFAPENVPRLAELRVEPVVALFGLAISSMAGVLCGLAPAWHASHTDLHIAMKERTAVGASTGTQRFSLRGMLVVSEVALALMLLTGSALMTQSMARMLRVDTGFRTDHLLTAELNLPEPRYATDDARRLFLKNLMEKFRSRAPLANVAISDSPALTDSLHMMLFDRGTLGPNDATTTLQYRSVAPGFFETMGIPLIAGRRFLETDTSGAERVAIINESLVRRYFREEQPLGKTLRFGTEASDSAKIVGVVGDTRDVQLNAQPRPQMYFPALQAAPSVLHVFVRTSADPAALAEELRRAVWAVDKDEPVKGLQSMTAVIARSVAQPRFRTLLIGVFAAVGLTLTLVGVYGVISYNAGQRTREIGIRIALGAQPGNVLGLVLRQGIHLATAGAIIGVLGSLALARLLKSELFEISPADPLTLIGVSALMLLVALAACYLPARRATRIDPLEALRQE